MNVYAILSLLATAVSLLLGLSVYVLNRKSRINRLFMLTMFVNAYWAFCIVMKTTADSLEAAFFWSKVLSFWPFIPAVLLHFALAFTESDLLKKKFMYVLLYLPPLVFSIIDLSTDWIAGGLVQKPWGYANVLPVDSFWVNIGSVWSVVVGLLTIFFYVNYYRRVNDKTRKRQIVLVAFGLSLPTVMSIVSDALFPLINVDVPGLGSISGSITGVCVLIGMLRYKLFTFRPEIAAENVFSTMPDSVILVNTNSLIIKVNRSLVELSGYSESELIGKPLGDLIAMTSIVNTENLPPNAGRFSELRELRNYEVSFSTKSGDRKTGMLSCSIVKDNNGRVVGAAIVLNDISERKEMEQKLLRAERFASIGELATILGHDLRNPLSGIRGATFYLRRKHSNVWDREDLAMFEGIDKSIEYSNKIINDLLDYSREIRLDLAPVTPKLLLKETLSLMPVPQDIFVVDQTSDEVHFYADTVKVCRAFVNIVKNAVDAMPEGGRLVVRSEVAGEFAVFTFKDSGFGMSSDTLEKLWSPLFTTKAKGMGFGLAICRRFVEGHGGCVSVESVPHEGTTVRVDLPLFLGKKTEIAAVAQ